MAETIKQWADRRRVGVTVAKRLLHPEEVGAPVLADADVERIALRVADLLAERLST